jgi:hypothetical protein
MKVELTLHNGTVSHVADCKWCMPFGETFWSSGWEMKDAMLDFAMIKNLDVMVEWDNRTTEREKFAIPVVVHQKGKAPKVHAFTRNMSGDGVNLVGNHHVPESTFCMLEFMRNDGQRCEIIAQCVWTKRYGNSHWMSGWQFPRLERIAKFHEACFNR